MKSKRMIFAVSAEYNDEINGEVREIFHKACATRADADNEMFRLMSQVSELYGLTEKKQSMDIYKVKIHEIPCDDNLTKALRKVA